MSKLHNLENLQIIDQIRNIIKTKNKSVLTISKETDISPYRIYKWLDNKGQPKYEDVKKLEKYFENQQEEIPTNVVYEPIASNISTDYKSLYIEQLKKNEATLTENIRLLEEQLRLANEKAAASLDYIAEASRAQLAHQKALAWYQAYQAAGGNEKKLQEELKRLNNKTAEYGDLHSGKGSRLSS